LKYIEIFVKNALTKSGLENTDYSLNPYKGCEHQCVYCYAPYVTHISLDEWRNVVYVKRNLPTVLDKELKKKKGFVTLGSVTDVYQPSEKKYEITRRCLEILLKHRVPISILTKSSLVLRDLDLLSRFSEAHVGITLTTLDDSLRKKVEANSSSVDERLEVLQESEGKAIRYIFVGPILPGITTPYLQDIVKEAERMNLDYIIFDRFRWKKNMLLPYELEERIKGMDYEKIKRELMRISKQTSIPVYLDW